ncbi:MAG: prepilin-type N-terminal cleavage/methylation domain-containing protein [Spirochaetia bacterium]|nr:prepilin-type N-terminal cleavage/methylation domain-containing protein [Spirochaetota bacterium]MCX8097236.1 prepilin-type N-terminal cleavage/methylation domain-containing protein [Spirochaetota bacterium]MDW8111990.1 prepilin-type N-terminal cleavage/methylation domain-containing protein [Spirochaetia bacterium]
MLKKFTKLAKDNKGFSVIEVIVAILVVSIMIFSVVETYRYVVSLTSKSKVIYENINLVKHVYNKILLENTIFYDKAKFNTNISGTFVEVEVTTIYSTNPRMYNVIIFTTNSDSKFSVSTSIYDF